MPIDTLRPPMIRGRIWLHELPEHGPPRLIAACPNQSQYGWGYAAAMAFGRGQRDFRISTMYVEFENVAEPDDVVTPPDFGREEGVEYYDGLSLSGNRDFLRIAISIAPELAVAAGYEPYFAEGQGNQLTYFAMTGGLLQGVHGKEFSAGANSKIFGMALAATPVPADRTQDIIVARTYLPEDEQVVKAASAQSGLTWEFSFL